MFFCRFARGFCPREHNRLAGPWVYLNTATWKWGRWLFESLLLSPQSCTNPQVLITLQRGMCKMNRTGLVKRAGRAAELQRKHLLSSSWALTLMRSLGFISGSQLLAASSPQTTCFPLEHHSRSTPGFPPLMTKTSRVLHSWFNISSVQNLPQLLFMTNAYISLKQMSIKTSSSSLFFMGLKDYYLVNVDSCTAKRDSLSAKPTCYSMCMALPTPTVLVLPLIWHIRRDFLWCFLRCAFFLQDGVLSDLLWSLHTSKESGQAVQSLLRYF